MAAKCATALGEKQSWERVVYRTNAFQSEERKSHIICDSDGFSVTHAKGASRDS